MNKILKFRAYDSRLKKWIVDEFHIIGEFMLFGGFDDWIQNNEFKELGSLERYNDVIIQQFTGLQDKNNVNIYEGDILLRESTNFNYKYEVFWDTPEGSWKLKFLEEPLDCSIYLGDFSQKNLEVIGNIFQ